jgi:hypothetical protein
MGMGKKGNRAGQRQEKKRIKAGFTVGELVIVIAVIAILAGLIAPLAINVISQKRIDACLEELEVIKKAIVGDPTLIESGTRSSFGFVGDTGALPSNPNAPFNLDGLDDLVNNAGAVIYPAWQQDPGSGLWYGWRGPYINEYRDPWGRDYNYALRTETDDDKRIAFIWSSGVDGLTDTDPLSGDPRNDDNILISISQDEISSMVSGNTLDNCGAGVACSIRIKAPDITGIQTYPPLANPTISTTAEIPFYNTGDNLKLPIGIRRIEYNIGGIDYNRLIYINNGPNTVVNLRQPGTCPQ